MCWQERHDRECGRIRLAAQRRCQVQDTDIASAARAINGGVCSSAQVAVPISSGEACQERGVGGAARVAAEQRHPRRLHPRRPVLLPRKVPRDTSPPAVTAPLNPCWLLFSGLFAGTQLNHIWCCRQGVLHVCIIGSVGESSGVFHGRRWAAEMRGVGVAVQLWRAAVA